MIEIEEELRGRGLFGAEGENLDCSEGSQRGLLAINTFLRVFK